MPQAKFGKNNHISVNVDMTPETTESTDIYKRKALALVRQYQENEYRYLLKIDMNEEIIEIQHKLNQKLQREKKEAEIKINFLEEKLVKTGDKTSKDFYESMNNRILQLFIICHLVTLVKK